MAPTPTSIELLATLLFGLAVLHTFCVKYFARWAHRYPSGSVAENVLHFLAETEVIFGLWGAALFVGVSLMERSVKGATQMVEALNFTEPQFVFVIMVVAATRPVVTLAERIITASARLVPLDRSTAFYVAALSFGSLLGSVITEPAAMTLLAMLLKRRYFDRGISVKLAYVTLGLLFVNVSIGGTLTHFAAPPVLMVAAKWQWDSWFMLSHFGWRAVASCIVSALTVAVMFRKELRRVEEVTQPARPLPVWLTLLHLATLSLVVLFAHHPSIFFGVFMIFLGIVSATREFQDGLRLREGLLVGFFLSGLVVLGSMQAWWLKPLVSQLSGDAMFFGALGLTAFTDNAALTYLGTLVEGMSPALKYALVAGAVAGGGLTVIANAPNPAGIGILGTSKVFGPDGISPLRLLMSALYPTSVAIVFFWLM